MASNGDVILAQDIFIGVDGGGTKCKVRVEDSAGNLIGQAVSGSANIRLSIDEAWRSIYSALDEVLMPRHISLHDPDYHFHAGLGLAGYEITEATYSFLRKPHPFKTVKLISDAHAACLGAHGGNDGAIIIVGTGMVGYQIQDKHSFKVSGWGFPHDDVGSGAWLGLEAARLTFEWLDHRSEKSPLAEEVFAFFNHNLDHFVVWANQANATEFARLAPLVINHSQQEEIVAVRLMKKAAHAVERASHALSKMSEKSLPLCLFGGIAPFLEIWLDEALRHSLTPRKADATTGSILMIRQSVPSEMTLQS